MTTLVLSILNGSSLFLQIRRTTIKAWMSLNFGQIPFLSRNLAALEYLKTTISPGFQCNFYSDLLNTCR